MMARIDLLPVPGADFVAGGGRQAVDMDTSASPQMLLTPKNPYGSSFQDTLGILSVDMMHLPLRTRFMGTPESIRIGIRPLRRALGTIAARAGEVARAIEENCGGTIANNGYTERYATQEAADIVDTIAQSLGVIYGQNSDTPLIQSLAIMCNAYGNYLNNDGTGINIYERPLPQLSQATARMNLRVSLDTARRRGVEGTPMDGSESTMMPFDTIVQLTPQERELLARFRTSLPDWKVVHRDPITDQIIDKAPDDADIIGAALQVLEQTIKQAEASKEAL